MKYYFLETYDRLDRDFCFIDQPVEEIRLASWKIIKGASIEDEYPESAAVRMSDQAPGRVLTDFIGNEELCLIVSKRIKELFESIVSCHTEYLPLSIINHKNRVASKEYFYINPIGTLDALNHDQSVIKYLDGDKDRIVRVRKFVLSQKKLSDAPDLFRIKEKPTKYVISQKLLDALRSLDPEPTNLVVKEIKVAA